MSKEISIQKVAIIADIHYNYEYNENYDKSSEILRAIKQIMKNSPDVIFVLGDLFDYRRADSGGPLSIEQGDKKRNPLVKIINDTKIPWFIILGNHEKYDTLEAFEIMCSKLKFLFTLPKLKPKKMDTGRNYPIELESLILWGSSIQEKGNRTKNKELILREYCKTARNITTGKKKILLTHLNMIKTKGPGIEEEILKDLNESFDLVLNGHEHTWAKSGISNYSNLIQIPALLPWHVRKGIGFIQKLNFNDGILKETSKLRFPNGFVLLDVNSLNLNYIPFYANIPHIQIHYDITGKDSEQIANDWAEISQQVAEMYIGKNKIQKIIIKPVIEGVLKNIVFYHINAILKNINNDFPDVIFSPIATGDSFEKAKIVGESDLKHPELKWESILSKIIENSDNILTILEDEDIHFTNKNVKIILEKLKKEEKILTRGNSLYSTAGSFITSFLDILNDEFNTSIEKHEIESILSEASIGGK
ncbi:MAG: metallophosphoesterase family protein [Candidatus Thorarchaeota archaeon]